MGAGAEDVEGGLLWRLAVSVHFGGKLFDTWPLRF